MARCFLESLLKASDSSEFLFFPPKQGTEKAEGSGENEAQQEDKEPQEKAVSVCCVPSGFVAPANS